MPLVRRAPRFERDLATLRGQHAAIDQVVDDFCNTLARGAAVAPPVYAHRVDYPPFGFRSKGRFLVTFVERPEPVNEVLLLSIEIAPQHLN
jgi:hypothetical protein